MGIDRHIFDRSAGVLDRSGAVRGQNGPEGGGDTPTCRAARKEAKAKT